MNDVLPPMTATEELAAFASDLRYEHIPAEVIERLQLHILDLLGVCLVGARMPFLVGTGALFLSTWIAARYRSRFGSSFSAESS